MTVLLRVRGLRVSFGEVAAVDGVDFTVAAGECLAIVGESGSGKSLTARALLGLAPEGARVSADELSIGDLDARGFDERGWRGVRGARVGFVSQDALVSLDPLRRIGDEVGEALEIHRPRMRRADRRARVLHLLSDVAMREPARRVAQRPHELSGGLRQRALIASALAGEPVALVADEPTTALDATVQARVLDLLRTIVEAGVALVFISHDFAAVRRVADRVAVMKAGRFVEQGTVTEVLDAPRHPYTRELVAASLPGIRVDRRAQPPALLVGAGLWKSFDRPAVREVDFALARGRTLGIVGESGSGKTTLARMMVGVERPDRGAVTLDGVTWSRENTPALRRRIQLVHQNPLGAFDPRWTIGRSLHEALAAAGVPRAQRRARAEQLLGEVGLEPHLARARPGRVSGGQRQRAAIARALAADPEVLVLDEPVSALDATVRTRVLTLLRGLQDRRGLAMVFVSHDLDVVAAVADDVLVMQEGAVVESGPVAAVFGAPQHPFTRELLAAGATPRPDAAGGAGA